jgi:hypothetical protein
MNLGPFIDLGLVGMKFAPFVDLGLPARGQRPPRIGEAVPLRLPNLASLLSRIGRRSRA